MTEEKRKYTLKEKVVLLAYLPLLAGVIIAAIGLGWSAINNHIHDGYIYLSGDALVPHSLFMITFYSMLTFGFLLGFQYCDAAIKRWKRN